MFENIFQKAPQGVAQAWMLQNVAVPRGADLQPDAETVKAFLAKKPAVEEVRYLADYITDPAALEVLALRDRRKTVGRAVAGNPNTPVDALFLRAEKWADDHDFEFHRLLGTAVADRGSAEQVEELGVWNRLSPRRWVEMLKSGMSRDDFADKYVPHYKVEVAVSKQQMPAEDWDLYFRTMEDLGLPIAGLVGHPADEEYLKVLHASLTRAAKPGSPGEVWQELIRSWSLSSGARPIWESLPRIDMQAEWMTETLSSYRRPGDGATLRDWGRIQPLTSEQALAAWDDSSYYRHQLHPRSIEPSVELITEWSAGAAGTHSLGAFWTSTEALLDVLLQWMRDQKPKNPEAISYVCGEIGRSRFCQNLGDSLPVLADAQIDLLRSTWTSGGPYVIADPSGLFDPDWRGLVAERLSDAWAEHLRTVPLAEAASAVLSRLPEEGTLPGLTQDILGERILATNGYESLANDLVEQTARLHHGDHLAGLVRRALPHREQLAPSHLYMTPDMIQWARGQEGLLQVILPESLREAFNSNVSGRLPVSQEELEECVRSGAVRGSTLVNLVRSPVGGNIAAAMATEALGDRFDRWELLTSMLGDWRESLPKLLETVKVLAP